MTQKSIKLLLMSGSARQDSLNTRLLQAAGQCAIDIGAVTTFVNLRDLALPVFDADSLAASGMPAGAIELRNMMANHDGVLLASPEYNALPTPLLINTFDWMSCVTASTSMGKDYPSGTNATANKPVGLLAASPGALGGIRALPIVRVYLSTNFSMLVVPEQMALPAADKAFSADGRLIEPKNQLLLERVVSAVVQQVGKR